MNPKTNVKFDKESFNRLKRTMRNMSLGKREAMRDSKFAMQIPDEVGIQLTNRCNLRCRHCFQWNEDGFHRNMDNSFQNGDISFDTIEKIMRETEQVKSNLYLWGGEPLCYNEFERLANLMEKDQRWTVFCTNGIDIEKNMDSILKISSNLAILTSVEGFETENDYIRGKGTFKKVINNINLLLDLKKKGIYKGEVSVNCVISESMIGKMYEFAEMFEEIGINTLYFCFPWYIPKHTAIKMDTFFKEKFSWLRTLNDDYVPSWHSYQYTLNPEIIDDLMNDIDRLNSRAWNIRMRYQPALEKDDIRKFITGSEIPVQQKSKCMGIRTRMNVMADGKATVCKLFPEFEIGDLNNNSVIDVWNSSDFQKAREIINCGLMPVCSKCILLYLHGV